MSTKFQDELSEAVRELVDRLCVINGLYEREGLPKSFDYSEIWQRLEKLIERCVDSESMSQLKEAIQKLK